MRVFTKSLTVLLSLSAFGFTSYMLYLLLKKENEDDLLDNYVQTSKHKTMEIAIPRAVVRSLIGRNGSNIKRFQEQSNTRINFRSQEDKQDTICLIKGTVDACDIAYSLIQEFINNQPVINSEDLWIPAAFVKNIIGRGGEKINEINTVSGAKINVRNEQRGLSSARLQLVGTCEQISVAKSLIGDIVEQCNREKESMQKRLAKREPRQPSKSIDPVQEIDSPKYERLSPVPGQEDNQIEVYVSAVESPAKFWLQIVGPKAVELDYLLNDMTEYYSKPENQHLHILDEVNPGDLVAAIFPYDNKWYRAEVLEVNHSPEGKTATLHYVDYGDGAVLPCKDLFELRTDFLTLHFQAIECFLARVDPRWDTWSDEAINIFEQWCHVAQWKKVSARINGYTVKEKVRAKREGSPVPGVDLYDVTNNGDIDVAEELVKAGFAVFKKGSDLRSNSRNTSTSNVSEASSMS